MNTCRCERCCPHDPAPTYTEAHRLACLARELLGWPLDERRAFLDRYEGQHGQGAAGVLKTEIRAEWEAQKRQSPGGQDRGFGSNNSTPME